MDREEKVLRCVRINVWLTGALLVVLCVAAIILVPRTMRFLEHAEDTLTTVETLAETADSALAAANSAAETANRLAADNADAVSEALEKFNSVDFATLNKAIADLATIVEPLAKVSSFFTR